jgi:hypothetical protein
MMKMWSRGVCVALAISASVALAGCVEPIALEEGLPGEEALSAQSSALGACTGWSGWYWDGSSTTCDVRLACGTYCDDSGVCDVNPATYKQEYSYRVCFDASGGYTHTEYQYRRGAALYCGC